MAAAHDKPRKKSAGKRKKSSDVAQTSLLYIHGIGAQPPKDRLKFQWDLALFGCDMGKRSSMAYWADILHGGPSRTRRLGAAGTGATLNPATLLERAGVDPEDENAQILIESLLRTFGVQTSGDVRRKVLPLPGFLRRPIAREFLEMFISDTAAYFFRKGVREQVQARLLDALKSAGTPVTIVAHSQGSIVTYEVLSKLRREGDLSDLVTIGSPLGVQEVQDFLDVKRVGGAFPIPAEIKHWYNFADPLDPVALDKGLSNEYGPDHFIEDALIWNTQSRKLEGFDPHSAVGYLAHPKVRRTVHESVRYDRFGRFVIARDVAEMLGAEARHSVLIEILEPGYAAAGETPDQLLTHEEKLGVDGLVLKKRIETAAGKIKVIVGKDNIDAARIDTLRRFVSARLTPSDLLEVAAAHVDMRVYSVWKSSMKKKLLHRSGRVVKADAAFTSYGAGGKGVTWAVLDTGVQMNHPHFAEGTITAVWDCTKPGPPKPIPNARDVDGHGTHVSGIIAGSWTDGKDFSIRGLAPQAHLIVYKVLDNSGAGEDAWIIKALDHIAELNENSAGMVVHGLNLSLGGPYDSTVYGCGFSPICAELRRLWRSGVLVCVACGNEGQVEVDTPDGSTQLNSPMSIGDPANLEDCIAVGSVHADKPHLYGISAFSSHGPTSDGRVKPDVVAPGERIKSCDAHFKKATPGDLYYQESGTSMSTPHVSGLLAAFLSVRPEFRGRPDEVKELLLRTCTDIRRDRYHQGRGIPNLMKMLTET